MILEFRFEFSKDSFVYENILQKLQAQTNINSKLIKSQGKLCLYVGSEETQILKEFATKLSSSLPLSIYLTKTQVQAVATIPDDIGKPLMDTKSKPPVGFCPQCLADINDTRHKDYANIFKECSCCGYGLNTTGKNYLPQIQNLARDIKDGKYIKLNTGYGTYTVGAIGPRCNNFEYDIVAYDLAVCEKYTTITSHEVLAMGAIEKPSIKLKTNLKFKIDFEETVKELVRFKLSDDVLLYLLSKELYALDIELIFITKENIAYDVQFDDIKPPREILPPQCVVGANDILITDELKTDKNYVEYFDNMLKNHRLQKQTVAGVCLSKHTQNSVLLYGEKFGIAESLSFKIEQNSIANIFDTIATADESGAKLVQNYQDNFKDICKDIIDIKFDPRDTDIGNLVRIWGIVAIVLGYTTNSNLAQAGEVLIENILNFQGDKGPRVDYKIANDTKTIDTVMLVRTAMSFRLAGIESLTLSYGVVESFCDFLSLYLDDIAQTMDVSSVVAMGDMLEVKPLFINMSENMSKKHKIYFPKKQ